MCLTKIEYESGAILIPFSVFQSGLPDDVDLGAVQNKLSYDDLKKCGERMKNHVGANYKIRIGLLILAFLFVIMVPTSIALFADPRARSLPWMTFVFFVAAMLCYICYGANAVTIERKLKQLIEKENQEIWNSKGLYWEYAKHRNGCKGSSTTYLELRVLSVAMDYRAPGQFQYSFQGTIPNPYMQQQQGNYMPYLELSNCLKCFLWF